MVLVLQNKMSCLKRLKNRLRIRRGYVDLSQEKRIKKIIRKNIRLRKKAMKKVMTLK